MDLGGISIHEMENMARNMAGGDISISNDIGNVIEISDMAPGDDLGVSMLANPGMLGQSSAPQQSTFQVSTGGGIGDLEVSNLDSLGTVTLDLGGSSQSQSSFASAPIQIDFQKSSADQQSSIYANAQTATGPSIGFSPISAGPPSDPEKERREKIELLNKLQRLEGKGYQLSRRFTSDNSLDELRQEFDRVVDARNLESSLRFQRQALMGVVTGLEWLNTRFDPFDLKLDGWSESVHENQEDFDEIFEELYDKYKDKGKMPPEARLIFALAGSGFMCHVSNTFLRSKMPSMDDVLKQNPDLARQVASAAASAAGPGFGNFMNMAMGGPAPVGPAPSQQSEQGNPAGAFFGSSHVPQPMASVEPARATARKEMRGPSGVDDILRTFEEARAADLGPTAMPPPVAAPQVQPAVMAAVEMQSMVSDDIGSTTESTRTGGRGRRRKQAVGNTLSLNV
jgi:Family of unknown function (DUF5767)